ALRILLLALVVLKWLFFFFQAEDGIRDFHVTGVQTCALPIYGVGNIGTAFTTFSAPMFAEAIGWQNTVRLYLILIIVFSIFIFILGDRKESKKKKSMLLEIKSVYKNATLWILSLFYFITFGAFVAFTVFLPSFLVSYFELTPIDAGIRTAIFIIIA